MKRDHRDSSFASSLPSSLSRSTAAFLVPFTSSTDSSNTQQITQGIIRTAKSKRKFQKRDDDTSDDDETDIEPLNHIGMLPPMINASGVMTPPIDHNMNVSTTGNATTGNGNDAGQVNEEDGRRISEDDFKRVMVLGSGAYAKVILVQHRTTRKLFAMKILKKDNVVLRKQQFHTMAERRILSCSESNPFIIRLFYAFQTKTTLNFVLDYCSGGELFYHLARLGSFPEDQSRFYAGELCLALGFLHANGILYRDLKPENILIDNEGHIKLVDFGLSKEGVYSAVEGGATFCGTPEYLAPEMLKKQPHGTAVDWWALGCILYEMLTGLPPFYDKNRKVMFQKILTAKIRFPAKMSQQAQDLITGLLNRDPPKRLGSNGSDSEVRKLDFWSELDWERLYAKGYSVPWIPPPTSKIGEFFDKAATGQPLESIHASSPPNIPLVLSGNMAAMEKAVEKSGVTMNGNATASMPISIVSKSDNTASSSSSSSGMNGEEMKVEDTYAHLFEGFSFSAADVPRPLSSSPVGSPPLVSIIEENLSLHSGSSSMSNEIRSPEKPKKSILQDAMAVQSNDVVQKLLHRLSNVMISDLQAMPSQVAKDAPITTKPWKESEDGIAVGGDIFKLEMDD